MQHSKPRSASTVTRLLALQAGVAMWLCLFGFLLDFYLGLNERNLMPGITGQKGFDIARFAISALASGLLVESIVIGRYSDSKYNLKVWYITLLFLLPYFHHFLPSNSTLVCCGLCFMLYASLMSEVRLWMVDHTLVGRLFYVALALPTLFMATDTFVVNLLPTTWWYLVEFELPMLYACCFLTAITFTVHSSMIGERRPAFTSSLVVLNAVVWYLGIVKPY